MADFLRRRSGLMVPEGYGEPLYRPPSSCDMLSFGNMLITDGTDSDPYYSSVSLLLQPTSAQADGTITDFGPNAFTITKFGNITTSNANIKFSNTKSLVSDGTTDGVSAADNAAFYLPGDFTAEAWIYPTNNSNHVIFDQVITDGNNRFSFYLSGGGVLEGLIILSGSITLQLTGVTSVSINNHHYVRFSRSGNTWSIYLDSTTADATTSNSNNPADYTSAFAVGSAVSLASSWLGAIDSFRLTKGIVRPLLVPTTTFQTS